MTSTKKATPSAEFEDTAQTLESSYRHLFGGIVLAENQALAKCIIQNIGTHHIHTNAPDGISYFNHNVINFFVRHPHILARLEYKNKFLNKLKVNLEKREPLWRW